MNSASLERMLQAVIAGAAAILEKKSFPETARTIFDLCRELTGAVSGYVALLSETGEENEVLFLEAGGKPCSVNPELPMPIRGLRAIAYKTRKAAFENDFMKSEWIAFLPHGHVAMKNVLFAPLNIEGKTVGIIGLANKPTDFTREDAEVASLFGELAAIALQNSRHLDLLHERTVALEQALAQVKTLHGFLPICAQCKKIRNDSGYWTQVEAYISEHTDARFTHGLCPECIKLLYPDYDEKNSDATRPDTA